MVVLVDSDFSGERRSRLEALCGIAVRVEGGAEMIALENSPPEGMGADLLKLTSGTSGEVRAIRFSAAQLLADCDTVCETMGIAEGDRNYGAISFAHSYGFSSLITPLLCRGIPLVVADDMMPRALLEGLTKSRATVFPAVPAVFRTLAGVEPEALDLRLCISAGAPLTAEVAEAFRGSWGRKLHSFYGASESGGICYDASEDPVPEGFVGPPMKGVDLRQASNLPPGRIEVRSAAVGLGYHPPVPGGALGQGVFVPSDILEGNGSGYVISGRTSETLNIAGRKVSPQEIEGVLRQCSGVRDVAVFGLPAVARGEDVAVCVVGEVTEGDLKTWAANRLPAWKVPRHWRVVAALPVNARGKTSREALRALFDGEAS